MGAMSAMELVNLLLGSGVLFQGMAILKWVMRMETRMAVIETRLGTRNG